jgi:hypothetical protein
MALGGTGGGKGRSSIHTLTCHRHRRPRPNASRSSPPRRRARAACQTGLRPQNIAGQEWTPHRYPSQNGRRQTASLLRRRAWYMASTAHQSAHLPATQVVAQPRRTPAGGPRRRGKRAPQRAAEQPPLRGLGDGGGAAAQLDRAPRVRVPARARPELCRAGLPGRLHPQYFWARRTGVAEVNLSHDGPTHHRWKRPAHGAPHGEAATERPLLRRHLPPRHQAHPRCCSASACG